MKQILDCVGISCAIKSIADRIESFGTENLCFISILKGGVYTTHELLSHFSLERYNTIVGYLGLSSYSNGTQTQSQIEETYPLDLHEDLSKKNIWIIDDIFDSGLTMMSAKSIIKQMRGWNSIRTAVLVRKMNPKIQLWKDKSDLPDIVGFEYDDSGFLVGCGMGLGEKYRCLDGLYELEPEEIGEE